VNRTCRSIEESRILCSFGPESPPQKKHLRELEGDVVIKLN